jgi:DNA polymerase-3 subunit epsilon
MNFVALDVETANPDVGSICQIGLAEFKDGILVREWESLVNPETHFHYHFTRIHGLNAATVAEAPRWPELTEILKDWLAGQVVGCHTLFDQRALTAAYGKYGLKPPLCRWVDSCRVARRAWAKELDRFNLATVCAHIGHQFRHHNALEDAKAAGTLIVAAVEKTGLTVEDWLRETSRR